MTGKDMLTYIHTYTHITLILMCVMYVQLPIVSRLCFPSIPTMAFLHSTSLTPSINLPLFPMGREGGGGEFGGGCEWAKPAPPAKTVPMGAGTLPTSSLLAPSQPFNIFAQIQKIYTHRLSSFVFGANQFKLKKMSLMAERIITPYTDTDKFFLQTISHSFPYEP